LFDEIFFFFFFCSHPIDEQILTLRLFVAELPSFHLQFQNRDELEVWKSALLDLNNPNPPTTIRSSDYDLENSGTEDEDFSDMKRQRFSSAVSSYGAAKSYNTAPTEYSLRTDTHDGPLSSRALHVPLDIVVVIPMSSSMQGLKISLLRDCMKFLVSNLGERDRMGLVSFGSSGGGVPLVGMTSKTWEGWSKALDSIKPVGQKALRADAVEGANVAMDLLMQRKSANPVASILLISDSSTSDSEGVDFVVQRAEAAKYVLGTIPFPVLTANFDQGHGPLFRAGIDAQTGHHDRTIDAHQGVLHVRQRLDDAPRMHGRVPGFSPKHVASKRQTEIAPARRLTGQICKDQRRPPDQQTGERPGC